MATSTSMNTNGQHQISEKKVSWRLRKYENKKLSRFKYAEGIEFDPPHPRLHHLFSFKSINILERTYATFPPSLTFLVKLHRFLNLISPRIFNISDWYSLWYHDLMWYSRLGYSVHLFVWYLGLIHAIEASFRLRRQQGSSVCTTGRWCWLLFCRHKMMRCLARLSSSSKITVYNSLQ